MISAPSKSPLHDYISNVLILFLFGAPKNLENLVGSWMMDSLVNVWGTIGGLLPKSP